MNELNQESLRILLKCKELSEFDKKVIKMALKTIQLYHFNQTIIELSLKFCYESLESVGFMLDFNLKLWNNKKVEEWHFVDNPSIRVKELKLRNYKDLLKFFEEGDFVSVKEKEYIVSYLKDNNLVAHSTQKFTFARTSLEKDIFNLFTSLTPHLLNLLEKTQIEKCLENFDYEKKLVKL